MAAKHSGQEFMVSGVEKFDKVNMNFAENPHLLALERHIPRLPDAPPHCGGVQFRSSAQSTHTGENLSMFFNGRGTSLHSLQSIRPGSSSGRSKWKTEAVPETTCSQTT